MRVLSGSQRKVYKIILEKINLSALDHKSFRGAPTELILLRWGKNLPNPKSIPVSTKYPNLSARSWPVEESWLVALSRGWPAPAVAALHPFLEMATRAIAVAITKCNGTFYAARVSRLIGITGDILGLIQPLYLVMRRLPIH